MISLMAGMELAMLGQLVAPAKAETIMIPFPAIAGGGSPVLVMGDVAPAEKIFGQTDNIIVVSDHDERKRLTGGTGYIIAGGGDGFFGGGLGGQTWRRCGKGGNLCGS